MADANGQRAQGRGEFRSTIERRLRVVCIVPLVCTALATVVAGLLCAQTLTYPRPKSVLSTDATPASAQADAVKELRAQIDADRKEAEARIDERLEGVKLILGTLVTLVGVYSVILGFTAFMTIKYAREDAKEQIASLRDNAKDQLKDLQARIEKIQSEFPEFASLHGRVEQLVRDLQRSMRSEADWNDDETFKGLSEIERQGILNAEIVVAAISVFALDRSPAIRAKLAEVHAAFARFYLGRHTVAGGNEADHVRAAYYASVAIEDGEYAARYLRLRGAIYLAHYDIISKRVPPPPAEQLKNLLQSAKADLADAISKDTAELVDAGAYYNMAVAQNSEGKRLEAAKTLRNLIRVRERIPRAHREKYLPFVYSNLACYLALAADETATADPVRANELSTEAVAAARDGFKEFEPDDDRALRKTLLATIAHELVSGNDLAKLAQGFQDELRQLDKPAAHSSAGVAPGP